MSPWLSLDLFLGWSLVQFLSLVVAIRSGKVMPLMHQAVVKAGDQSSETPQEEMAKGFLWISVIWFVVVTAIAAICYGLAMTGSKVAFFVFIPLAIWSIYQAATNPIVMQRMYPSSVDWKDWASALISTVLWAFLLVTLLLK
jgi:hypothetical protein